jgi:hypothetical protein
VIRAYLIRVTLRALGRFLRRSTAFCVIAAACAAAAPAAVTAFWAYTMAWLLGWPPRRLYRAAAWCAPMLAVLVAAAAAGSPSWAGAWRTALWEPLGVFIRMWQLFGTGRPGPVLAGLVTAAPVAIPAGLLAGGLAWSYRAFTMAAGTGGRSPAAPVSFDLRQWRHQVRTARARTAAPGSVPLTGPGDQVVVGATIRTVQHPARVRAAISYPSLRSHQVVIGTTGTGKTTLLLRLWAGFIATAWRRYSSGRGRRPLLVVLDCKGGADSRRVADRVRRVLHAVGARSVAVWPDEARLSMWDLPAGQLITTLLDLIEHGTGAAAYYRDVMEAVVSLAVRAPCGPPASSADFLSRLDADWLMTAYASSGDGDVRAAMATVKAAARQVTDVALRFRSLMRRLGDGLDGPGGFADADVWYCILEGTAETAVAEAQARALVDILAWYAAGADGSADAEILLAVDEFSAVSRRLPIWTLYERARSLGLAVQVSSQSWQGLAADDDERYRIAATADGGIWLLRTPYPDPVAELAGERRLLDTTRRLLGGWLWSGEGHTRAEHTKVVNPDIIRSLDVGQAAYISRGGVTYVQVKRVVAGPAALPAPVPAPVPPHPRPGPGPGAGPAAPWHAPVPGDGPAPREDTGPRPLPDARLFLDEVLGGSPDSHGTEPRS